MACGRDTVLEKLAQQDVGCFVVRDSTTHAGCYALSIRVDKHDVTVSAADQGISHYLITRTQRGTVKLKVSSHFKVVNDNNDNHPQLVRRHDVAGLV